MKEETKFFEGFFHRIKFSGLEHQKYEPVEITKENVVKELENFYNSLPVISWKAKEPRFVLDTNLIEKFTKKGYLKNGELTKKGNKNISELLPYLRWDY